MEKIYEDLLAKAKEVSKNSYSPYSKFKIKTDQEHNRHPLQTAIPQAF